MSKILLLVALFAVKCSAYGQLVNAYELLDFIDEKVKISDYISNDSIFFVLGHENDSTLMDFDSAGKEHSKKFKFFRSYAEFVGEIQGMGNLSFISFKDRTYNSDAILIEVCIGLGYESEYKKKKIRDITSALTIRMNVEVRFGMDGNPVFVERVIDWNGYEELKNQR